MSGTAASARVPSMGENILDNDAFRFVRSIIEGRPYFGSRFASSQGDPARHGYMDAVVAMLAASGRTTIDILEVGSWAGGSAVTWARALQQRGLPGRVYCVDHWKQRFDLAVNRLPVYSEMARAVDANVIEALFHHNVSAAGIADRIVVLRGAARDVLPALAPGSFDLVFIDGSHLHRDVVEDLGNATALVRAGGILCGDDLELQIAECDVESLRENIRLDIDYARDPASGISYHPGVTAGVADVIGSVVTWKGFWAMQRRKSGWIAPILPHVSDEIPEHLAAGEGDIRVDLHVENGFAVFDSDGCTIAIAPGMSVDDLLTVSPESRASVPLVVTGGNLGEVRERLAALPTRAPLISAPTTQAPPVLVRSDCCGFNILKFGGRFYAVSQQLGPLDLAATDIGAFRTSRDIFVADSQSDAELLAKGMEAERSLSRISELETEIASQDLVLAQRQTEMAQLTERMAATCRQYDARLNDAAKAFELQAQLVETLRAVCQQYEIRVADAQQRLHDLDVPAVASLESKRQQYEARLAEAQQQITTRDAAIHEGRADLAAIQSQLEQTGAALDAKVATNERLQLEVEEMRSWIDELQRRLVVAIRQRALFRWLRRT